MHSIHCYLPLFLCILCFHIVASFYPISRFEDGFGGLSVEDQPDFEFFEPSSSLQLAVPMKRNYYMHVWRNIMEKMPHYKAIAHRNKRQLEEIVPLDVGALGN